MPEIPQAYVQQVQSPLAQMSAALEVGDQVREARLARERELDQRAVTQALQLYPTDPDQAVSWLKSNGRPAAALVLETHVATVRSKTQEEIAKRLENRKAAAEMALGMLRVARNNPAAWRYVKQAASTLAPHLAPLIPTEYPNEATFTALDSAALSAKEFTDAGLRALEQLPNYQSAASTVLSATRTQGQRDEAFKALRALGTPTNVLSQYDPVWSPQANEKDVVLGMKPEKRIELAETERSHRASEKQARDSYNLAVSRLNWEKEQKELRTSPCPTSNRGVRSSRSRRIWPMAA